MLLLLPTARDARVHRQSQRISGIAAQFGVPTFSSTTTTRLKFLNYADLLNKLLRCRSLRVTVQLLVIDWGCCYCCNSLVMIYRRVSVGLYALLWRSTKRPLEMHGIGHSGRQGRTVIPPVVSQCCRRGRCGRQILSLARVMSRRINLQGLRRTGETVRLGQRRLAEFNGW